MKATWRRLSIRLRILHRLWSFSLASQGWAQCYSQESQYKEEEPTAFLTRWQCTSITVFVMVHIPQGYSLLQPCSNQHQQLECLKGGTYRTTSPSSDTISDPFWWMLSAASDHASDLVGSILYDMAMLGKGLLSTNGGENQNTPLQKIFQEVPVRSLCSFTGHLFRRLMFLVHSFAMNEDTVSTSQACESALVTTFRLGVVVASLLKWFPDVLTTFCEEFQVEIKYTLNIKDIRRHLNQKNQTILAEWIADALEEIVDTTLRFD